MMKYTCSKWSLAVGLLLKASHVSCDSIEFGIYTKVPEAAAALETNNNGILQEAIAVVSDVVSSETSNRTDFEIASPLSQQAARKYLLETVYEEKDFVNQDGQVPPYWEHRNVSNETEIHTMGPCYMPNEITAENWRQLILQNEHHDDKFEYSDVNPLYQDANDNDLSNMCRPSFVIIGAGKTGTSSLYQYLVGHPKVLPAKNKQVDYYRYHSENTMKWYLSNFPRAQDFLSSGALMTGEASPGYQPYPKIAHMLGHRMQTFANSGQHLPKRSPRIISIGRNPLERSYSSYNYNYRDPLIKKLREEDEKLDIYHDDEWYMQHRIFSFEQMVQAELHVLRECLLTSLGEERTFEVYSNEEWAVPIFERRRQLGQAPLIDIETCYGDVVSDAIPRRQWTQLVQDYPEKIINVPKLHVVQSMVGRSLYTLPLEWWYELYPKDELYLVCNEELKHDTANTVSKVSDFLGLPRFDFTEVTSKGHYNVGKNVGYNTPTQMPVDSNSPAPAASSIPISIELKLQYEEFVRPFNERLFELTGKRCNW